MAKRNGSGPKPGPAVVAATKAAPKGRSAELASDSVVAVPDYASIQAADGNAYVMMIAQIADAIPKWGSAPKARDRLLRDFFPLENYLMSALASVAARNTAFSWTIEGPDRTVKRAQDMLVNANRGKGWQSLMTQVSMDLYSQDAGAFVELLREKGPDDSIETTPVVNVAHLDAARMYPTGNPDEPYWYLDIHGRFHKMKWFQVVNLQEMPSAIEHGVAGVFYQLQYCAVTRLLRAAQILRNVGIYNEEKTGGRFERAIHLVRGITAQQISDAVMKHRNRADESGLTRFIQTPIVGSVDPKAEVGASTLELASLPAGWDDEKVMKWYIAGLALAFLTDYQEFAPLPGGNLGTSAQSEVLHMKSRGKGPALFQGIITHLMNFGGVLPQNVTFKWDEQDIEADKAAADLKLVRAQTRQVKILSGEYDPQAARQEALDEGDMSPEIFQSISDREDETADIVATNEEPAPDPSAPIDNTVVDSSTQAQPGPPPTPPAAPAPPAFPPAVKALATAIALRLGSKAWGQEDDDDERTTTISAYLQTRLHRAFTLAADDIAGMGILDTAQRINLSGIIGDTLRYFSDAMYGRGQGAGDLVLDDDDIETLLEVAGKAYADKARSPALKRARVAMERQVQDPIEKLLGRVYSKVTTRIRQGRLVA